MAAIDYFLKLDGIFGESKDSKHKGEIDVLSFSFGETHVGSSGLGAGGGAGKVHMSDFSFTARTSKASPQLFMHCAQGKHIKQAFLTARKSGGSQQEYLKIKLVDLLVSGVQFAGHGSELLTENVTLNFAKFHLDYQEQKPDGSGTPAGEMGWDVKANQKF